LGHINLSKTGHNRLINSLEKKLLQLRKLMGLKCLIILASLTLWIRQISAQLSLEISKLLLLYLKFSFILLFYKILMNLISSFKISVYYPIVASRNKNADNQDYWKASIRI
jgi:hypothetical protein